MKKYLFLAMVTALISGCSSDDECNPVTDDTPVEIKVNAGIFDIKTRAPVNTGQSVTAKFVASGTTGDYSTPLWNATGTFSASTTASAAFSFTPAQYYPTNGSTVYIKGYYPQGSLSGNTATFSETDGSNDVMITGEASGSKATATALGFTFSHLLTQLQFTFKAGAGFPTTGKNVTSISIKNQQTPASLNINDGSVTYNPVGSGFTLTGTYAISADPGTTATVYPMVKSGLTSVILGIIADGVTYPDVTVSLTTETGKAHNITLTFTPKEITATAIVTAWITGGTGSSTIQ